MNKFRLAVVSAAFLTCAVAAAAQDAGTKTVNEELLEYERQSSEGLPVELLEAGKKAERDVRASGVLETALKVGEVMPAFALKDAYDKGVSSQELLSNGHIVLVFYRGAWCPYCNLYLRGLQRKLSDFRSRGADLVAISVEPPDRSLKVVKDNKLEFTVLSDPGLVTARKFGIVYSLPKVLDDIVKASGLDIAKYNGMDEPQLPVSATYVVSKEGKIEYAFLEIDYKKRAAPDAIIAVLERLNGASK